MGKLRWGEARSEPSEVDRAADKVLAACGTDRKDLDHQEYRDLKLELGRLIRNEDSGNAADEDEPEIFIPSSGGWYDPLAKRELLLDQLEPWVEGVRKLLFGSADEPPFATEEAAKAWLVEGIRQRREPSTEEIEQEYELREAIRQNARQLERLTGARVEWSVRPVKLVCWIEETKGYGWVTLDPDSDHAELARHVRAMAHLVEAPALELELWVLTGNRPERVAPVTIRRRRAEDPYGLGFSTSYVTVRLNVPLSFRDLKELYKKLKARWSAYEDRPRWTLIREIVHQEIGSPEREKLSKPEGERVAARWNERGIGDLDWRGARELYHRATTESDS